MEIKISKAEIILNNSKTVCEAVFTAIMPSGRILTTSRGPVLPENWGDLIDPEGEEYRRAVARLGQQWEDAEKFEADMAAAEVARAAKIDQKKADTKKSAEILKAAINGEGIYKESNIRAAVQFLGGSCWVNGYFCVISGGGGLVRVWAADNPNLPRWSKNARKVY